VVTKKASLENYTFWWQIEGCANKVCVQGDTNRDFIQIVVSKVSPTADGTFKVNVTASDKLTGASGKASLILTVDTVPTAGQLVVDPVEGDAWSTNFTIEARGYSVPGNVNLYELLPRDLHGEITCQSR
jgi:hypothetical protein